MVCYQKTRLVGGTHDQSGAGRLEIVSLPDEFAKNAGGAMDDIRRGCPVDRVHRSDRGNVYDHVSSADAYGRYLDSTDHLWSNN